MRFDVITIFPSYFETPLRQSLLGKAQTKGLVEVAIHNLRDFTSDRHKVVDDASYGGGAGMVLKIEPLIRAVRAIRDPNKRARIVYLTPQGKKLHQQWAHQQLENEQIILICGRYEGVDERFVELAVDEEISIGDFVLSGGEAAALILIEVISRLIPGVVGNEESLSQDSFTAGLLGHPVYTRPQEFEGKQVPDVLLSGDHRKISKWRGEQARKRTLQRRPDLLQN